jgi:hypothetical protein
MIFCYFYPIWIFLDVLKFWAKISPLISIEYLNKSPKLFIPIRYWIVTASWPAWSVSTPFGLYDWCAFLLLPRYEDSLCRPLSPQQELRAADYSCAGHCKLTGSKLRQLAAIGISCELGRWLISKSWGRCDAAAACHYIRLVYITGISCDSGR